MSNRGEYRFKIFNRYTGIIFSTLFIIYFSAHADQPDSDCIGWFENGKIEAGTKTCESECAVLMTDMGTFMCPNQCPILCKEIDKKIILGKILYYPGLTPEEKKLIEKNPKDAVTVFIQKTRAEWSSGNSFPEQGLNDEGDAFRHFLWAGLITKELGSEKAKEFLSAHEVNPLQSDSERDMDQFNNEKGISSTQNLLQNKKWSIENLEKSGLDLLRSKNLKFINPGLKIPEVPK